MSAHFVTGPPIHAGYPPPSSPVSLHLYGKSFESSAMTVDIDQEAEVFVKAERIGMMYSELVME